MIRINIPARGIITVDDRYRLVIERDAPPPMASAQLIISVYPITDGAIWDAPYEVCAIDEARIIELEIELREAIMSETRNTIIHGDCLDILPELAARSIDFILTDPPYIARYKSRDGRTLRNDDNDAWLKPAFAEMYRVLKPDSFAVSFYGWPQADRFMQAFRAAGFRIVGHLVFPKHYTSGKGRVRYQHECAYLLAKGDPPPSAAPIGDVIPWTTYTGNKLHPTQKPLAICKPLIEAFSQPGDWVLDPFAGSGSTLLAAERLGRDYIGIELDVGYHRAATARLAESVGRAA